MTEEELFEEIRALLFEAQADTVEKPWHYQDEDLQFQVRSILRYLKGIGVSTDAEMDTNATFTTKPTDSIGLLIAYMVVSRLLKGDLVQKLLEGELGIHFRAGRDVLDTKTAARAFADKSDTFEGEAKALLTIILTDNQAGTQSVYGDQTTQYGNLE